MSLKQELMLDLVRNKINGLVITAKDKSLIVYTTLNKETKEKINSFIYPHNKRAIKEKINIFFEDFSKY